MRLVSITVTPEDRCPPRSGFSLVELLVVIGVIAILSSLILPAIAKAKAKAHGIVCLNNLRQVTLGWIMYAADHDERLVWNIGGDRTRKTVVTNWANNWINDVMTWELDSDNTNVLSIRKAKLAPYTGGAVELYRCPADRALSSIQRQAGWAARVRSISMNAMLGYPGESFRDGVNVNNPGYLQFLRITSIPHPENIFVFLDEHPDSINDGYFLNNPDASEWVDLPASNHSGAGDLSFADGHAEVRHWLSVSTRRPAKPDGAGLPFTIPPSERADFDWLTSRMSIER